jgi:phage gp36-like protein
MWACIDGNPAAVVALLSRGARCELRDDVSTSPTSLVCAADILGCALWNRMAKPLPTKLAMLTLEHCCCAMVRFSGNKLLRQ